MSTSKDFRLRARSVMRQRLGALMLTALVFVLVDTLISILTGELTGVAPWNREISRLVNEALSDPAILDTGDPMAVLDNLKLPDAMDYFRGPFAMVLAFLLNLMTVPLSAGYVYHTLSESRHSPTRVSSIFYGFQMVWKTLGLSLLTGLLVFLGLILFIVPGVIFVYRYSMSLYILVDDPSKGIVQCMRESGQLMRGNKWRLFKLELSFIGWMLLSGLIANIIGIAILDLWLMPYMYLARAAFYDELLSGPQPDATPLWP